MLTYIIIECVDVSATSVAALLLLRMVIARPAMGWSAPAVEQQQTLDVSIEVEETHALTTAAASEPADDGITWPTSNWPQLAA
jgi:hypothetical protein